jgi:hypothetical protein
MYGICEVLEIEPEDLGLNALTEFRRKPSPVARVTESRIPTAFSSHIHSS